MIKTHKKTIILTNIVMLIPVLVGLLLWRRLPDQMPIHFSFDGVVDGWTSKPVAVFALPLAMMAVHWFCILCTSADPKSRNIGSKMVYVVLWSVPVTELFVDFVCYANALGYNVDAGSVISLVVGLLFVVIGNYLPKSGQSYTVGIKVPWTLNSEENWNRTHRLAGWLWTLGGLLFIAGSLAKFNWTILVVIPMAVIPTVYSFILYKRGI